MISKITILTIYINLPNFQKFKTDVKLSFINYFAYGPMPIKFVFLSMFLLSSFPLSLAAIDIEFNVPSRVTVCEIYRYSVQVKAVDEPVGNIIATVQMPDGFSYLQKSTNIAFPEGSSSTQDPEVHEVRLTWKLSDLFDSGPHIVINEFEQNPEGGDSGNEWVELYNPTGDDVDIGGWKLVNNDGDEYDILDGTIISPKDFWCHTFGGLWLDNSDEGIKIYDGDGSLVDETPIKADSKNDAQCWARYPNGYDTDSNSDWSLLPSTKGSSNGDLSPGEFIIIEFDMIASCAANSGQKMRAEASYTGGTSAAESLPITVFKGPCPPSTIKVIKTASSTVAKPLDEIVFTITVTNIGESEVNPVNVVDLLPVGMNYIASNAPFSADLVKNPNGTTTVSWNGLGPFAPGASTEIAFSSRVDESACGKLINSVVAIGTSPYGERVYSYDVSVIDLWSLNVSKVVSQNTVKRGDAVTYTITVCNEGSLPLNEVVVWDVFDKQVKLLSFSPHPNHDGRWYFGQLDPGDCVQMSLTVEVPKQEVEFKLDHTAQGVGFVDVTNKFSTTLPSYVIHNTVYALCNDVMVSDSDLANVTVSDPGSEIKLVMHGSGYYDGEGKTRLHTENKSLEMEKDVFANYSSTSLGLYRNRSSTYSSRWFDLSRSKNRRTGSYMHESYRYASNIDRESYMKLDENESIMVVDSNLDGMADIGFFKERRSNATFWDASGFSSDERYLGSFRIKERIDECGSGITSDRFVSGTGFVAVDKKIKDLQGTYESGTGLYRSEERINTHTNYLVKDINTTYESSSYKLTGYGTAWANQSQSWKEGMWSQNKGANFIGEKYSGASRLDKEAQFLGLNQMESTVNFSGRSSFRAVLPDLIDVREESFGEHSLKRRVFFRGVPKYDMPHMEMNVDGEIFYLQNAIQAARYVIVLKNDGNRTLGPVHVTDVFPCGSKFINASIRPSNQSSHAANWTFTHLSIGDEYSIVLWLNVTECSKGVLTNEVCAWGGHGDQLVKACNFSTLELDWLTCYLDHTISATKTAFVDTQEDDVVWYNLTIHNLMNSTLYAHVTDSLPEGMVLLNSSLEPSSYENGEISWNYIRINSFENQTINYRTKVHWGGTFVNRVVIESDSLDGLASRPSYASSVVVVDSFQGSRIPTGWRPPDWGFDYGGHLIEDLCEDYLF